MGVVAADVVDVVGGGERKQMGCRHGNGRCERISLLGPLLGLLLGVEVVVVVVGGGGGVVGVVEVVVVVEVGVGVVVVVEVVVGVVVVVGVGKVVVEREREKRWYFCCA